MTTPAAATIRNVSDTALWVAIYRAMESERPDAIFRDPFARTLAGARGEAIVAAMPKGMAMAWPMIVRTAVIDELVLRCVKNGATAVLNLAAGLDTRAYRMALPPTLKWYDVDLPDMSAYRAAQLAHAKPVCVHQDIAADLTDAAARTALFTRIGADAGGPVLVIAEGLLIYLAPAQVAELARELHGQQAFRWWVIDIASPQLLKFLERSWKPALGNAPFLFAPAEGTAFFAPLGWREAEFRSTWEESIRLKRTMKMSWLWRAMGAFQSAKKKEEGRRFAGIVQFERM